MIVRRRHCGRTQFCGIIVNNKGDKEAETAKPEKGIVAMGITYTYWQDPKDGMFVGYWNDYPDFPTQGRDLPELEFMLRDIRSMINDGTLVDEPRKIGVMEFA